MGKGISLGTLQAKGNYRFKINFRSVFSIHGASGITLLCNNFIFFLLSSYNDVEKTGSKFIEFLTAPLIHKTDQGLTAVVLMDEIDDTVARFKQLQSMSFSTIPSEELLDKVNILAIEINSDTAEILVDIEIYNILGQKAKFTL